MGAGLEDYIILLEDCNLNYKCKVIFKIAIVIFKQCEMYKLLFITFFCKCLNAEADLCNILVANNLISDFKHR